MKSLRVFVCILVVMVSFFGGFSTTETVSAQGSSVSAPASKSDLQNKADTLFSDFISQLQAKQADSKLVPALKNASPARITEYVKNNEELIKIIRTGQSTFSRLFSSPQTTSTNIYGDFTAALNAAQEQIASLERAKRLSSDPAISVELRRLYGFGGSGGLINDLAQERQDELKEAGQGNAAGETQNAAGTQRGAQVKEKLKDVCSLWPQDFDLTNCIDKTIAWLIKNTLLQIAGFLVWLTANMFNYAVQIGILNFSIWAPDALYPIWMIIRQIVSLIIVFMGLYLGLLYILGDEKGRFEKYIPWVIIFGLFVNFSYPLTRTAIDISNIVSLNIYAASVGGDTLTTNLSNVVPLFSSQESAGALIMTKLGLQGLIGSAVNNEQPSNIIGAVNSIPGALMAVAFTLYAAYIFFMVTAIIAIRTAALVFITVASPLLLVDAVLPVLGEKAQQLRKIFFEQLIVGPVFMIMFALTLKFLDVFSFISNQSLTGLSGATSGSTIVTFFNLLMMLIMLHVMITVTKKVSGDLGNFATSAMGKVGGFGLGVASGGVGMLARKGLGGLAMKARESGWVKNNQDSIIGRRVYDMSNSLANSTFDLRNSNAIAGGMQRAGFGKGLLGMGGMGQGTGLKVGYEKNLDTKTKDIQERMGRIKTRHERDEYKLDSKGEIARDENNQPIMLHRKGDIDVGGQNALDRYVANSGGTRFLTKSEKAKIRVDLGAKVDTETDKRIAETKRESAKDIELYNSITSDTVAPDGTKITAKEQRARFLADLEKDLKTMEKTDPSLRGNQAQSLLQSIQAIKKKEVQEKVEFNKKVARAIEKLNSNITKEKKEEYLSDLDDDIKALIVQTKTPNTNDGKVTTLGKVIYSLKDDPASADPSSPSVSPDLDLSEPSTPSSQTLSNAPSPELELVPKENTQQNTATASEAGATPPRASTAAQPLGGGVADTVTESFAERRKKAAEAARKNMDDNDSSRKGQSPPDAASVTTAPAPRTGGSGGTPAAAVQPAPRPTAPLTPVGATADE